MNSDEGKRMISDTGYEVKYAIHFGDCEVLVAENMKEPADNYYLVANYKNNGIISEYSQCMVSSDYLEIVKEFISRLNQQTDKVISEISRVDFQSELITAEQCYPHNYGESIDGKVVVIKAEVLRPEYRRGDRQLVLVNGGNGAKANPMGNGVYCYRLYDGSHTRFERYEVLGEMKQLPVWAVARMAAIKAEKTAAKKYVPESVPAKPEKVAGYTITERVQIGEKLFVLGENPNAVQQYVTWQHLKGRSGYDLGHYFTDREKALGDLHSRVDKERENTLPDKTRKSNNRDDSR